ncbi:hypothetical protein Cgig2_002797 [Carnegiea gigantea]|uniref:AB hydrolase-1 domain-containing protein n=1 Tax=Carnegiea gigantea TaxID=171969 RepID=A0A9Q1KPD9_9CARY|nr:hypothetical protein Cgig2_002797 [Carnegiea gigantea]
MKHFVLVHGVCHGAWCWYKVVTLLKKAGHQVTALDLGGCGVHPRPLHEIRTIDDHLEPLMAFMGSLDPHDGDGDREVILVGHSFGGIPISLAMEKFRDTILVAVFVSAYMPNTSSPPVTLVEETFKRTPLEQFLDTSFGYDNGPENGPTSALFGPNILATKLYQNCPPEDVELGKLLVKKGKVFAKDLAKEGQLTTERFGKVDRVYVICEEDEMVKPDFQQWMIDRSPPSQVISIPQADHMVMLSRPQQLCRSLLEIADKY